MKKMKMQTKSENIKDYPNRVAQPGPKRRLIMKDLADGNTSNLCISNKNICSTVEKDNNSGTHPAGWIGDMKVFHLQSGNRATQIYVSSALNYTISPEGDITLVK